MGIKPSVEVGQIWKARDGDMEVIEYKSAKEVKVRFLATGYERWTWAYSIKRGNVKDKLKCKLDIASKINRDRQGERNAEVMRTRRDALKADDVVRNTYPNKYRHVKEGSVWKSNNYGKVRVIKEVDDRLVLVYFINTGYSKLYFKGNIAVGSVVDDKKRSLPNTRENKIKEGEEHIYRRWKGMLDRCYDDSNSKYPSYGGKGVFVVKDWHNYSNYRHWFLQYYPGEGYEVDSDLRNKDGVKHYSPEGCLFLPERLNLELVGQFHWKSKWPRGVDFHKSSGSFRVRYSLGTGFRRELGYFKDPIMAGHAYADAREKYLKDMARELHQKGEINDEVLELMLEIDLHKPVDTWAKENPDWEVLKESPSSGN